MTEPKGLEAAVEALCAEFIGSMHWSDDTPSGVRELVVMNVRGFSGKVRAALAARGGECPKGHTAADVFNNPLTPGVTCWMCRVVEMSKMKIDGREVPSMKEWREADDSARGGGASHREDCYTLAEGGPCSCGATMPKLAGEAVRLRAARGGDGPVAPQSGQSGCQHARSSRVPLEAAVLCDDCGAWTRLYTSTETVFSIALGGESLADMRAKRDYWKQRAKVAEGELRAFTEPPSSGIGGGTEVGTDEGNSAGSEPVGAGSGFAEAEERLMALLEEHLSQFPEGERLERVRRAINAAEKVMSPAAPQAAGVFCPRCGNEGPPCACPSKEATGPDVAGFLRTLAAQIEEKGGQQVYPQARRSLWAEGIRRAADEWERTHPADAGGEVAAAQPDAGLVGLLEAAATMLNQEAAGNCPDHPVSIADLLNMAMRLTKEARRRHAAD